MSDAELRALERRADAGDLAARGRLERDLLRAGRDEQDEALALLHARRHVYLTGPAGTGKSHVVRRFLTEARAQGRRRVLVAGTTGVAAVALGGTTLHRLVGLPVPRTPRAATPDPWADEVLVPKAVLWDAALDDLTVRDSDLARAPHKEPWRRYTAERLRAADAIVLDEVSMADARALDHASWLCARARDVDAPFGGLQVVLVGDLGQLPPVEERWGWCYESAAWRALDPVVAALTRPRRQGSDAAFAELLGRIRLGEVAPADRATLAARVGAFDPRGAVRILSTNAECDAANTRELAALHGPARVHDAQEFGSAALLADLDRGCPSPRRLALKPGARVLLTANDPSLELRWANGTAGVVREIGVVEPVTGARGVLVDVEGVGETWVGEAEWTLRELGPNGGEVVAASRRQYPLRLGWAITAHRAQGATLARASVNLERCFAPGQAYVALSRVRSLEGLNLESSKCGFLAAHPKFLAFEALRRVVVRDRAPVAPPEPPPLDVGPVAVPWLAASRPPEPDPSTEATRCRSGHISISEFAWQSFGTRRVPRASCPVCGAHKGFARATAAVTALADAAPPYEAKP